MNPTQTLLTLIVLTICALLAYAKGIKDGRKDEREELQNKHKFTASRQLHKTAMTGPFWRN